MYRLIILLCHLFLLENFVFTDRVLTLADDNASVTKGISPKYGEFMRGEIRKERMMGWPGGKVRISRGFSYMRWELCRERVSWMNHCFVWSENCLFSV